MYRSHRRSNTTASTAAALGAIVLAVVSARPAFPFDPPTPNPYLEKQLAEKRITRQEWLLFDGIRKRSTEQVAYALDQGADPNKSRDTVSPYPPLIVAITQHSPSESVITLLIEKGAEVNGRFTPKPEKAPDSTFSGRMLAMLANKSSIGERTPLHFAASHGTPHVIALLISRGADLEAKNSQGQTPLFEVPHNKRENADALLAAGAHINARENSGRTVLWYKKWSLAHATDQTSAQTQALRAYIDWLVQKGAAD